MSTAADRLSVLARATFGVAAAWQFVSWGGRISLLTEADRFDQWNWARIGGSLLFGVLLGVVAIRGRHRSAREVGVAFLVFSLLLWGRSLAIVWSDGDNSLGFRLVHTALAVVTWSLAAACFRASRPTERPASG
jgi:hypothetical protein